MICWMDLLKFKAFRITGRIMGALLLGAAVLIAIKIILNFAFGGWYEPDYCNSASATLVDCCWDCKQVPPLEIWLIVFPILAVMAVAGIKLLKLRKPETAADDPPL